MTHDLGTTLGAWIGMVRRARIGRERKQVALMLSSYANNDGTSIFCGVAALAVDCEIGYSTARRYLAWMRQVGLIELVRSGNQRKGLSDEYRLITGTDVLEHLDVLDPDEYEAAKNTLRERNSAGRNARRAKGSALTTASADQPSELDDRRSSRVSADEPDFSQEPALTTASAEQSDRRSPRTPSALALGELPPPLYTSPERTTSPLPPGDIRTDLTVVGTPALLEDPISPLPDLDEPLPPRCPHGLASRLRQDGRPSCAICRRELAPVIPIRSTA